MVQWSVRAGSGNWNPCRLSRFRKCFETHFSSLISKVGVLKQRLLSSVSQHKQKREHGTTERLPNTKTNEPYLLLQRETHPRVLNDRKEARHPRLTDCESREQGATCESTRYRQRNRSSPLEVSVIILARSAYLLSSPCQEPNRSDPEPRRPMLLTESRIRLRASELTNDPRNC